MRLPRWTVYPAIALLAVMLVLAFPHPQADQHQGAARSAQESSQQAEIEAQSVEVPPDRVESEADRDMTPPAPAGD